MHAPTRRTRLGAAVGAVVFLVALAGCGDTDGDVADERPTETPSESSVSEPFDVVTFFEGTDTVPDEDDDAPDTFSADVIPADAVTSQLEATLQDAGYTEYAKPDCGELADAQDATAVCTVVVNGDEYSITATVTATDATSTTIDYDLSPLPTL